MVRGALPLLVDVRVAALARIGLGEIVGGNVSVIGGLCGAGEEWALRTIAFVGHGCRSEIDGFSMWCDFSHGTVRSHQAATGDQSAAVR